MNLLELFRHQIDLQDVAEGQVLFTEGERGNFMYVLISGSAEIFVRTRLMEIAKPGTIVGEMAIVGDNVRTATVVGGCKNFCVNGHLAGNCLTLKGSEHDRSKENTIT